MRILLNSDLEFWESALKTLNLIGRSSFVDIFSLTPDKQVKLQYWLDVIRQCRASGLTNQAWCKQHGISLKSYYYWIAKIRKPALADLPRKDYGTRALKNSTFLAGIFSFLDINSIHIKNYSKYTKKMPLYRTTGSANFVILLTFATNAVKYICSSMANSPLESALRNP